MIALTTPIKANVPVTTTVEKEFTHVWIQQLTIDASAPASPLVSFNLLPCNAAATEFAPSSEIKNVTIQNIFDPANMTAEVADALRAIEVAVLGVAKARGIIQAMSENENAQQQARRPRFDGTVNLGHILTAGMMLISGLIVWNQSQVVQGKQDVRIAYIEKTATETAASVNKVAEMQQKMAQNQERLATTLEMLTKKPQL